MLLSENNLWIYIHNFCWLANVTLGSACVADQQCTGSLISGVCSDGYCKCQRGYIFIQDKCFPGMYTISLINLHISDPRSLIS